MKNKIYILIVVLSFPMVGLGQKKISLTTFNSIIQKTNNYFKQAQFGLNIKVSSFKGHNTLVAEDESYGYLHKNNGTIESYQLGTYSIENNKMKILIDSSAKRIGITYPDSFLIKGYHNVNIENYKPFISQITLKQENNGQHIIIYFKKGLPNEKIVLVINKNGFLAKMTLYQSRQIAYKDAMGNDLKDKAKIMLEYQQSKPKNNQFKISDIILKKNGKYTVTKNFKSFQLIDFRYNP